MATPLKKGSPIWLAVQDPHDPFLNPNYRRSVRYYRQLYLAWPEWCSEHPGFKRIYDQAAELRKWGRDVQVDHVVPICSPIVCGLHVPWNLEIIPSGPNASKGNHIWPGHPCENNELFPLYPEPYQTRLPL